MSYMAEEQVFAKKDILFLLLLIQRMVLGYNANHSRKRYIARQVGRS